MLVLSGTAVAVSAQFVSLDFEPVACDEVPTCTATPRFGGAATDLAVESSAVPGEYRAVLEGTDLGIVDLDWGGVVDGRPQRLTDLVEVVGGEVASVVDVLGHPDLRSRPSVDRVRLRRLLSEFTVDVVTGYRGESPVPRRAVERLPEGRSVLGWPCVQSLSVTVDGVQVDGPQVDGGIVDRSGWPSGTAVVDYVHGFPVLPEGLRRAAMGWVAATVVAEDAGMARDALWQTTESGTIRYSTPDPLRGRPTGLIAVDAALNALPDYRDQGVG